MSKSKKIIIFISIIILLGVAIGVYFVSKTADLNKIVEIAIEDVNLSNIKDGTYEGSYDAFPISVVVEVTVQNNEMTKIDLIKHFNGQGEPAEVITDKVVQMQSLQVDAISGATYSSKVILLAIQEALLDARMD